MTVFLWQADGPEQGARGVTDAQWLARRHAAAFLLTGQASSAVVQEAVTELGMRTLGDGYYATGPQWRGTVGDGGLVRWVPDKAGAAA